MHDFHVLFLFVSYFVCFAYFCFPMFFYFLLFELSFPICFCALYGATQAKAFGWVAFLSIYFSGRMGAIVVAGIAGLMLLAFLVAVVVALIVVSAKHRDRRTVSRTLHEFGNFDDLAIEGIPQSFPDEASDLMFLNDDEVDPIPLGLGPSQSTRDPQPGGLGMQTMLKGDVTVIEETEDVQLRWGAASEAALFAQPLPPRLAGEKEEVVEIYKWAGLLKNEGDASHTQPRAHLPPLGEEASDADLSSLGAWSVCGDEDEQEMMPDRKHQKEQAEYVCLNERSKNIKNIKEHNK